MLPCLRGQQPDIEDQYVVPVPRTDSFPPLPTPRSTYDQGLPAYASRQSLPLTIVSSRHSLAIPRSPLARDAHPAVIEEVLGESRAVTPSDAAHETINGPVESS